MGGKGVEKVCMSERKKGGAKPRVGRKGREGSGEVSVEGMR